MKKLLFWAVLLMTGFAFYSCDERFDNPVAERQDSSSPNATWSYEVGLKFQNFSLNHPDLNWNNWGTWDVDGEEVTYKAPSTVYVYNKAGDFLGELTATEEFDYDAFNWDKYYKFAGTLKGAIGDELVISTLKDFDYYSKQDGTLKSIAENCILQVAEVPIIVANNATKTIGTQNAELKSAILAIFGRFSGISDDSDRSFTLTSDSLAYIPENEEGVKTFTINLAEAVKPQSEGLFWAFAPGAKEEAKYTWELNSENGYKSINVWKGNYGPSSGLSYIWDLYFTPIELDLTKYTKFLKEVKEAEAPYDVNISTENSTDIEPLITQSGKDPVEVHLSIQGKATIQGINIGERGSLQLNGYKYKYYENENDYLPILTVKGTNTVYNKDFAGICINATATIKGDGTITSTGDDHGLVVNNSWSEEKYDESGWSTKGHASELTIAGDVTIIAKGLNGPAVFIGKPNAWSYPPGTIDPVDCAINFEGGTLEAIGKGLAPGIVVDGKMTIGTGITSLKATAGETSEFIIVDGPNTQEAALDILVADKTKFTDKTEGKVRTITPKK
jgi:hypothetical protein